MGIMETEKLEKFLRLFDVELPSFVLEKIVVLFLDNNPENWEISNLDYCFGKEAVECPFYKGYFYIPGFSRYVINRNGELLVVKTGTKKKWSKSVGVAAKNIKGGYFVSHGIHDVGRQRKGLSRHRLLCLAFKHPGSIVKGLTVNHKDGIPGNDSLENLELCTYSQNTIHAYNNGLYYNKTVAVNLLNWKTGETKYLHSVSACIEITGLCEETLRSRLLRSNGIRYPDGWRIKRKDEIWETLKSRERESVTDVEVICRNIFDNKIYIFGTISEASRETKVKPDTIRAQINSEVFTPVYGWNFRRLEGFESWPVYTDKHIEIFKENPCNHSDGIEVYDCEKNKMLFFTTQQKAGEYFGISHITASKLARYEKTRANRYKFKLFRIR